MTSFVLILILLEVTQIIYDACKIKGYLVLILILLEVTQIRNRAFVRVLQVS